MQEDYLFKPAPTGPDETGKPPVHSLSLVFGILSLVFSLLIALFGEAFGIVGIVLATTNRKEYRTTAALVCSIIGLALAVANHITGIVMLFL